MSDLFEIRKLEQWLKQHAPENVLMPLKSETDKSPKWPHAKGQWSWKQFESEPIANYVNPACIGILCRTLFVVDVDSHSLIEHLRQEWPSEWFSLAIKQNTKKGVHLIFRRPDACELYDGARQLKKTLVPEQYLDENKQVPIDFKTLCRTHTASVLVCSPTPGKVWVSKPWDATLHDAPEDLLKYLKGNLKVRSEKSGTSKPSVHKGVSEQTSKKVGGSWSIPISLDSAVQLAHEIIRAPPLNDSYSRYHGQQGNDLQFTTDKERGRVCPAGIYHDSNSFLMKFRVDGAVMYFCHGKACLHQIGSWMDTERPVVDQVIIPDASKREVIRDIDLYSISDLLKYVPSLQPPRVVYAISCACINECHDFEPVVDWAPESCKAFVLELGDSLKFSTAERRYSLKTVQNMVQKCYPAIVARVHDLYVRQVTAITLQPEDLGYEVITYNQQFVQSWLPYLHSHKHICVQSTMETGKTLQVEETCTSLAPKSALIVSPRKRFGESVTDRFMKQSTLDPVLYSDETRHCQRQYQPFMTCQVESLHTLKRPGGYQLLILDEIESIL